MRYPTAKELSEIAGVQQLSELYNVACSVWMLFILEKIRYRVKISHGRKIEFIDNMTSDQFDIIKNSLRLCRWLENEINFDCSSHWWNHKSNLHEWLSGFFRINLFHENMQNFSNLTFY